jgi:hypothetical protein
LHQPNCGVSTAGGGREHSDEKVEGATLWQGLRNPRHRGFLVVGTRATFPPNFWKALLLSGAPAAVQLSAKVIAGAAIATLTFALWEGRGGMLPYLAALLALLVIRPSLFPYILMWG